MTLGAALTRYVLTFADVERASVDDLVRCLRPAVETLLYPEQGDPPPS